MRPPRDPNHMSLWSVTDEGYRTLDVKKQTRMLERRLAAASAGLPGRTFKTKIIVGLGHDGGRL